jgi:ATP-dependent DNA ligase
VAALQGQIGASRTSCIAQAAPPDYSALNAALASFDGDGATVFEHACKLGFEGIVSKHRKRPYQSGPSKSWL